MRVAVVGAGMTGLVAALRLGREGHECDVFERWPGLGGQVATLDVGGTDPLERYYHHLFTTDIEITRLYEEMGMGDDLEWRPSSVAIFSQGKSHPFTTPLDLLRFTPMGFLSRLRMGLAVVILQRRHTEVEPFEEETAKAWILRSMGRQAWEHVWGPLLAGKFGSRAEDISMAWLWSKLTLRRRIEGSSARQELLGYPRGSWQPLLERLGAEITKSGGRVLIDRPVASISTAAGRFDVTSGAPDSFRRGHNPAEFETLPGAEAYDAVLATVPGDTFLSMLEEPLRRRVGAGYAERVRSIDYHEALCMLLELDRPFSPFYWTNVADPALPFIGLIEQTNFVEPERYGGKRFLYVANYLEPGDPMLDLEPDELLDLYEPGLRRVRPDFERSWIRARWRFREPAAQPIVTAGYRQRMPALETGVPGLVLANTTQIYPEDRGTNYSVRLGGDAARAIADSMSGQDAHSRDET